MGVEKRVSINFSDFGKFIETSTLLLVQERAK